MRVSTKSRYGLRAMVYIAKCKDAFVKSEILAKDENISKKYLDNILGNLRKNGLLSSMRGGAGGYSLRRDPENITVKDIVEALEGKIAFVPCLDECEPCGREKGCTTQKVWEKLSYSIKRKMDEISLADLINKKRK